MNNKLIDRYLKRLFPLNRSITGSDNLKTLEVLQEIVPLNILNFKSGKKVFNWKIPKEWKLKKAWIKNKYGKKIINFDDNNLHVVSYSHSINQKMNLEKLKKNLHFHHRLKNAIPYRTSYYSKNWGFCISKNQFLKLKKSEEPFEVFIDSELNINGKMHYGELIIPGKSKNEVLISTYICHPSMANDNLSGMLMTALLAKFLFNKTNKYTYRIVWVPETIGAIAYIFKNKKHLKKVLYGLEVATVGGKGTIGYKQSYNKLHSINIIIEKILKGNNKNFKIYPFDIHGSDERQYSSQGLRINMPVITKDKYYEYSYYHNSLDNLEFVKSKNIKITLNTYKKVIKEMENEQFYKNTNPYSEPMLSKYDLYPKIGAAQSPHKDKLKELDTILWILWHSTGDKGLYEISSRINISYNECKRISKKLEKLKLLRKVI